MGQEGRPGRVPDGVDPFLVRFHAGVHPHEAPLVQGDARLLQAQALGAGPPAHGHQDLVHHQGLLLAPFCGGEEDVEAVLLLLVAQGLGAGEDPDALLLQGPAKEARGLPVPLGQDLRHVLNEGDLRA